MIDRKALLADLRRQLKRLEQDLAERAENVPEMTSILQEEYRAARDAERTGDTFLIWRAGALSQAAVAWLLGCVFVRFAEDNGLVDAALIAGPGERNARAEDRQTLYFRTRPTDSDRDYLLDVFAEVVRLPGIGRLYDRVHNPVWRYGISGDAARDLLAFWRAVDPDTGALRHDFTDSNWDTRFLGDLYQDLSDEAKKRFALLQTPEFVEEFILDRTLTSALDEFGLPGIRLIDPACGSGHFLLGAFARLLRAWINREPGTPERILVQRALDSVYGVDINPFAAAIAQFRLLVAALRASRVERLQDAPNFRVHVTAGDSLLHGRRFGELDLGSGGEQLADRQEFGHAFLAEDLDELNRILGQQYHVVVGNPPYVTVKDKAVNNLYRARYSTCHRQYSLAVPFAERFFGLALPGADSESAGHVGMITSNSFMKREFGKRLIESFLPSVDLTHVLDSSGAYIPGHGTPTVILFGRHRAPVGDIVRSILGVRGEPATPKDPSRARVWSAIVEQVDLASSDSDWVSSEDVARKTFSIHPWSIGGGATPQVKRAMENDSIALESIVDLPIGRAVRIAEEDVFTFDSARLSRSGLAAAIDSLATERQTHLPAQVTCRCPRATPKFDDHRETAAHLLERMIALQEELDWECYRLYGVIDDDCRYVDKAGNPCDPPPLALGQRAFEIFMARRIAAGELDLTWFTRHGSTPITELPANWSADYRTLVERRIKLIATNRFVGLIERPEFKRRWNVDPWHDQEQRALRTWMLNRLESPAYWPATRLATVRNLAERAATDTDFQRVATRYAGHAGVDLGVLTENLVVSKSVPALPVQRYKAAGLAKRADWKITWSLQRREDEIDAEVEAVTPRIEDETEEQYATRVQAEQRRRKKKEIGDLTPPPKYSPADFLKPTYWRLRGALDVPKERFVSFPTMSRDSDPTQLVGWAGWNALELCQAVATYCAEVIEQDGWPPERLTPLLAALQENLPWLKQWHNEVDPEYNQRLGDFFETYLHSQLSNLGLTEDDLRTWAPPGINRGPRTRRGTGNADGPAVPGPRLPSTG